MHPSVHVRPIKWRQMTRLGCRSSDRGLLCTRVTSGKSRMFHTTSLDLATRMNLKLHHRFLRRRLHHGTQTSRQPYFDNRGRSDIECLLRLITHLTVQYAHEPLHKHLWRAVSSTNRRLAHSCNLRGRILRSLVSGAGLAARTKVGDIHFRLRPCNTSILPWSTQHQHAKILAQSLVSVSSAPSHTRLTSLEGLSTASRAYHRLLHRVLGDHHLRRHRSTTHQWSAHTKSQSCVAECPQHRPSHSTS